jgi:hypothetical protein
MPYIKKEVRTLLKEVLEIMASNPIHNAGELNYIITCLTQIYIAKKGESYQTYCEIEGVLSHVSKELYRKKTSIYEDIKEQENGSVW